MTSSKPTILTWNQLTLQIEMGDMGPAKKHKYYVVWKGRRTGIFSTWEECSAQVKGFTGARYKAFTSLSEAEMAFKSRPARPAYSEPIQRQERAGFSTQVPILESYSVDAACSGSPGPVEFRGVVTRTGREIFHEGPYEHGTNNVGEFLAIVHVLKWLKRKKLSGPVYSDSATAIKWVKRKICNTSLTPDKENAQLFKLISQAETWLEENKVDIPILKWETGEWGEIPADFNRK